MRHNQKIKNEVRSLRTKGFSLNQIFEHTSIPNTTIRSWIKDIKLSNEQMNIFKERTQRKLQEGRIRKQAVQKELKLKNERRLLEEGTRETKSITRRELLIAGIALYWAEGFKNKHEHRLGFCNSDPEMIRFYLKWLKEILGVKNSDVVIRLTINQSYRDKTEDIENYWLKVTRMKKEQFTKAFYQNTNWKKQYTNDDYHGVLRVHVKESLNSLLLMRGWIEGLKLSLAK